MGVAPLLFPGVSSPDFTSKKGTTEDTIGWSVGITFHSSYNRHLWLRSVTYEALRSHHGLRLKLTNYKTRQTVDLLPYLMSSCLASNSSMSGVQQRYRQQPLAPLLGEKTTRSPTHSCLSAKPRPIFSFSSMADTETSSRDTEG
ncbi:hypothetical protein EYB26_007065 [Talaromyces marneffei]|uniref:uncharacterized protein n=1 Tax=Talaromyces marneffei TaxID=37727 RepID=UPI0012A919DD|nr:uncharacterized protein EYB26_007065 [Talaromyces marneffei]QGA19376.1 hypothetical protein EYB26_007065 [Talaromyces marneffei]